MKLTRGTPVQAFDSIAWRKIGDVGDNECFWVEGVIVDIKNYRGETLYDVKLESGDISRGHFRSSVRESKIFA